MKKIQFAFLFLLTVLFQTSARADQAGTSTAQVNDALHRCFEEKHRDYNEIMACYRTVHQKQPLTYSKKSTVKTESVEKRSYELTSQTWMPYEAVTPAQWQHAVDIYVPDNALHEKALLVVNNGTNIGYDKNLPRPATDYSDEILQTIAAKTRTIVISVNNVPNQYLTYQHGGVPKREDDSVAYSWRAFLDAPDKKVFSSLHIPMMETVVKTMDLAERELVDDKIHRFIVTGASKRAWVTWFAAIVDPRIDAIVPVVLDILNTKEVLRHEYRVFGNAWPITVQPYVREKILENIDSSEFDLLMEVEDPLEYLDSPYAARLAILEKYIVNASGDSFFTPDNAQWYFDKLPGAKMLRVLPNSDHYDAGSFTESILVPFVNRFQKSETFPELTTKMVSKKHAKKLQVTFSEPPVEVKQWTAINEKARDFRRSCGIRYASSDLKVDGKHASVTLEQPKAGWTASYVEARFNDGLVVTSPVYVLPENKYPNRPEPTGSSSPICQIIQ